MEKNEKKYKAFCLKLFGIYFYVSPKRMKIRTRSDERGRSGYDRRATDRLRAEKHVRSNGKCELCGKQLRRGDCELHHTLPYTSFPKYRYDLRNVMLLCRDCHLTLHHNSYMQIESMERKAREYGFDLREWMDRHYGITQTSACPST